MEEEIGEGRRRTKRENANDDCAEGMTPTWEASGDYVNFLGK